MLNTINPAYALNPAGLPTHRASMLSDIIWEVFRRNVTVDIIKRKCIIVVLQLQGKYQGCLMLNQKGNQWELTNFGIYEAYRKCGYGVQMLNAALDQIPKENALHVTVHEKLPMSKQLTLLDGKKYFEKHGFEVVNATSQWVELKKIKN